MKADDARAMTPDQLSDELMKLKKEQFNLRFQRATGQQEGVARVRQVRRQIARVKTIMAEKTRSAARSDLGGQRLPGFFGSVAIERSRSADDVPTARIAEHTI